MFAQDTRICPMCRSRINQRDAHRIFLEFVDPGVSYGMSVVDGLNRIDHTAELRSVSKAKEKLERAALRAQGNEELTAKLLKAMEDLNERIIPVFTEIATQKEVISKLQEKVSKVKEERDGLKTRVHASQPLVKEVKHLKRQLIESEGIAHDACKFAEAAKDKAVALDLELRDYKTRVSDLAKNKRHVEDQLERHVAATRLEKEKRKAMKIQIAKLTAKLETKRREETDYESAQEHEDIITNTPPSLVVRSPLRTPRFDYQDDERSKTVRPSSMVVRSPRHNAVRPSSMVVRSPRHNENSNATMFDFEGMPLPGFKSDWQPNRVNSHVLKRRSLGADGNHRRVSNPIRLDKNGHPVAAVLLGPKKTLRFTNN